MRLITLSAFASLGLILEASTAILERDRATFSIRPLTWALHSLTTDCFLRRILADPIDSLVLMTVDVIPRRDTQQTFLSFPGDRGGFASIR